MSFKLYEIRSDIGFRTTYEATGLRYLMIDPVTGAYYKINFLYYQLLRFFQKAPSSTEEAAKYLDNHHDIEVEASDIEFFLENMRKKGLIEPDHRSPLTPLKLANVTSQLKEKIVQIVKRYWRKQPPQPYESSTITEVLSLLRSYDVYGALQTITKSEKQHPNNELITYLRKTIREKILNQFKDEEEQKKHLTFIDRIDLYDPQKLLHRLRRIIFAVLSPIGVGIIITLMIAAIVIFWQTRHFWIYGWLELAAFSARHFYALWVLSFVTIATHEFGHAIVCYRLGGNVRKLGILLFFGFMPGAFADVTDSYTMTRTKRTLVSLGGVLIQFAVSSLALVAWSLSEKGSLFETYALLIFLANFGGTIQNLLPIFKLDGYYILSDWTGIENLFHRTFEYLDYRFRSVVLGQSVSEPKVMPTRYEVFWFYLYGLTTTMLVVVSIPISITMSIVLWEEVASIPKVLLFLSLIRITLHFATNGYEWLKKTLLNHEKTNGFLEKFSTQFRIKKNVLVSLLVIMVFLIPIPHKISLWGTIKPLQETMVRSETSGIVHSIYVSEGDKVDIGQPLLSLKSLELETAYKKENWRFQELSELTKTVLTGPSDSMLNFEKRKTEVGMIIFEKELEKLQLIQNAKNLSVVSYDEYLNALSSYEKEKKKLEYLLAKHRLAIAKPDTKTIEIEKTKLASLSLRIQDLEKEISSCNILSNIKGTITTSNLDRLIGKAVKTGESLLNISSDEKIIELQLPEEEISDISQNAHFRFVSAVSGFPTLHGKIYEIATSSEKAQIKYSSRRLISFPPASMIRMKGKFSQDFPLHDESTGKIKIDSSWKPIGYVFFRKIWRILKVNFWAVF